MAQAKSFDEFLARSEPGGVAKARENYEKSLKKLGSTHPNSNEFETVREEKRQAALAMHTARQAAEADFYKEEVHEVKSNVAKYRAEQAAKAGAPK